MFILNNLKININAPFTGPNGTQYPANWFSDADARAEIGMVEVPDPIYPEAETHTYVENPDGSLTITERTPEDIAARQAAKVEQIKQAIVQATQQRLDSFAQTRGYDGILSACTYAVSAVPKFAAEGTYAVSARDDTWATLYGGFQEVEAGTRPMPTGFADIAPLLPPLVWPAEA